MPDSAEQLQPSPPSDWVDRFLPAAPGNGGGKMLDLAAGNGRHARLAASKGWHVVAVDRNITALRDLNLTQVTPVEMDLEAEPLDAVLSDLTGLGRFDAVVVTNYLHRPLLPRLPELLQPRLQSGLHPGGMLIYETFMVGNEEFGRPRNPDFLLKQDELFNILAPRLTIQAFEQGYDPEPSPRMRQRIAGVLPG